MISNAQSAKFKSAIAKYKEDVGSYIFVKTSEEVEENSSETKLEKVDDYIYVGDVNLNPTYRERLTNVKAMLVSASGITINNTNWDVVTQIEEKFHKERLAVEAGELIWFAENENEEYAKWCMELGLKVFVIGKGFITETGSFIVGSEGEFSNTVGGKSGGALIPSGTYSCAPELKDSFNTGCTYYLTYDTTAELTDLEKAYPTSFSIPIYKDPPDDWYDYGTKKWANIATVANGKVSYFTWIPRYMYKIDINTGKVIADSEGNLDIIFVNKNNQYYDSSSNQLSTPGVNYVLPDAFKFNGVDLSGIWVGKYEISDPIEPIGVLASTTASSITIESFTTTGTSKGSGKENLADSVVTITIGNYSKTGKLPITIESSEGITISPNQIYHVTVSIPTTGVEPLIITKDVMTTNGGVNDITAPDLTGFEEDNTYFVKFTSANEPTIDKTNDIIAGNIENETITKNGKNYTKKIMKSAKSNGLNKSTWYDYGNKQWANIVTMNSSGEAAYWVWVPRYEYKVDKKIKGIDVVFIPQWQETADTGYEIPDAFRQTDKDGNEIAGIWVGKYEMSDIAIPNGFITKPLDDGFKIQSITYTGSSKKNSMENSGTMRIYNSNSSGSKGSVVTGFKYNGSIISSSSFNATVGGSITNLPDSQYYLVEWDIPYPYKTQSGESQYKLTSQKIYVKTSSIESPDLSGFSNSSGYIYYINYTGDLSKENSMILGERVTFSNGIATNIKSSGNWISNDKTFCWYDYDNKVWANILVSSQNLDSVIGNEINSSQFQSKVLDTGAKITMWVWIPRYEYSIDKIGKTISTIFISQTTTSSDSGYEIPDAFRQTDTSGKELKGIWVGKYEIGGSSDVPDSVIRN